MIKTEDLELLYRTLRYAERPLTKEDKGRLLFISEENLDKATTIVQRELVEREEAITSINLDSTPEEEVIEFYDEKGELTDRLMTPEAMIIEDAIKVVLKEKRSKGKI